MMTRKLCTSVFFIGLALLAPLPSARAQVSDWKQIPISPLPAFHPQQPQRFQLPNGMVIFLQEDHELPLIQGTVRIRAGSREEPAAKAGLVTIYGEVWRTGGTKARTGDDLDDFLEAHAAKVETGGGVDSTTISLDCLKDNFDDVFKVFVELLREPAFREDKLPLAKSQLNTSIARRNDNPMAIASREAQKLGYGADSPYARTPEYATVAAVTRDDLVDWHKKYVHPNNIIFGITGDFDSKVMAQRLRAAFDSWPKGPAATPPKMAFHGPKPGVYFVEKADVNQSNIRMVELGTRRDNPDYYAIEVFNEIFGGSFSSRLVEDVRTKKGLAYAVGGGVGTTFDHPGLVQISMGTKSGTTAAAIQALYDEIDSLNTRPPTDEELKKAKDSILNSFVFRFDSKSKILAERMAYEFYGYPADFLDKYQAGIEKVTREDVERAAKKYIHKDQFALLVVGKAADFDKPLSTFGQVATLDITIPSAGGGAKKAKAAGGPKSDGRALLAKVIASYGGMDKVRTIKTVRQKVTILANTPQGEMSINAEQIVIFPDRLWQKMTLPMGEMTMVFSPDAAYMKGAMGSRDLPSSQKEEILNELKRDPFFIAQHSDDPKFSFSAGGTEKVGDVEANVLDVNADGAQVRWLIDPQTGRILRTVSESSGEGGPAETVVDYAEWKDVQGLSVPFKETRTRGGQKESSVDILEYEINPTVDSNLFAKPVASAAGKTEQP